MGILSVFITFFIFSEFRTCVVPAVVAAALVHVKVGD